MPPAIEPFGRYPPESGLVVLTLRCRVLTLTGHAANYLCSITSLARASSGRYATNRHSEAGVRVSMLRPRFRWSSISAAAADHPAVEEHREGRRLEIALAERAGSCSPSRAAPAAARRSPRRR